MAFRGELYYIIPIANVSSAMKAGILSNKRASTIRHLSFALAPVQEKRDQKNIPNGLPLHEYVNLYFDARNPALFSKQANFEDLCVLVISGDILTLPDVVLSDLNAASPLARFLTPAQIGELAFDRIYAVDWRHPNDASNFYDHRRQKCAEVLVPHGVDFVHVIGARVVSETAASKLEGSGFPKEKISIHPHTFFK